MITDTPLGTITPPTPGREAMSDDTIVERVRAGDTRLYEVLLRRYNQRLYRLARSILRDDALAQDAVQEAYVAAYFRLDQYVAKGAFGAWLSRIAVNEALMSKRKRSRQPQLSVGDDEGIPLLDSHPLNDPSHHSANRELTALIETAIDGLPEAYRVVFVLRGVQQLSIEETADSLGIPAATVKTRYHRARERLQQALSPHIEGAGLHAFEFAGRRCDRMVARVMTRLGVPWVDGDRTGKLQ